MAILIKSAEVEHVPDDMLQVRLQHLQTMDPNAAIQYEQRLHPYVTHRYRPQTMEQVRDGEEPVRETFVMFLYPDVQKQLLLTYEAWHWMSETIKDQSKSLDIKSNIIQRHWDTIHWYTEAPWYKRIWRALWRKHSVV